MERNRTKAVCQAWQKTSIMQVFETHTHTHIFHLFFLITDQPSCQVVWATLRKNTVTQCDLKHNTSLYTLPQAWRQKWTKLTSESNVNSTWNNTPIVLWGWFFHTNVRMSHEVKLCVLWFSTLAWKKTPIHGHLSVQESSIKVKAWGERKPQNTKLFIETNSDPEGKYLVSSAANSRRCWSSPWLK